MSIMVVVAVGRVFGAPPNDVLVKNSGMDAHALRYVWIETMHLCIPRHLFGKIHLPHQTICPDAAQYIAVPFG